MAIWTEDYVILNQYSRPGTKLVGRRGLVLHWTADPGATDTNEKNFFDGSDGGGGRYASAHLFVDRDSATLIIPLDEVAYHANDHACRIPALQATKDGYAGGANLTAIGVEMCVEKDGTIHPDTIVRTVQVMAELCRMFGLSANDIYRHYDITGKNCPAPFVANPALFTDFKNRVTAALNGVAPAPAPAPTPQPAIPVVDQYKGGLVDYLNSTGQDSSFANRAKLAAQLGIANYSGTAAQNVQLLALLRNGAQAAPAPAPSTRVLAVGDTVTVKGSATNFASGEAIADFVRGQSYKVVQVKDWNKSYSKRAYLLSGIMSWVLEQDVVESGVTNGAPAQAAPTPAPAPQPATRKLHLPASAQTWTVYKLDHPAVKANPANIAGVLAPAKYNGITYDIIEDFGGYVFGIQTGSFGHVKIYAAPSTGATIS